MKKYLIYSVEDDAIFRRMIGYKISMNVDYEVQLFEDAKSLISALSFRPDVLILDLNLPDMGGMELFEKVKEQSPFTQIIIVSAQDDIEIALSLLKKGAFDYIVKNEQTLDRLWKTLIQAVEKVDSTKELQQVCQEVNQKIDFSAKIVGLSPDVKNMFRLMEKTLTNSISVNIVGETGSGKELVAKAIHANSLRKQKPFIALNVAALPKELIESEMFGYEKGAFTGAHSSKIGKFEEAGGGTLFLDEISEMDLMMQAKLLRAIQEMEITPLGSNKIVKLNFRLIVASNKDLLKEVKSGRFREDLYYRLMGVKIEVPPLRQRGKDILILSDYFIKQFAHENQLKIKALSEESKDFLLKYRFPGNIRELKAIIETAFIMSESSEIHVSDLPLNNLLVLEDLLKKKSTLDEYNTEIILHYLAKNKWNVIKAANELGVGKSTIYRMINEGKIVLSKKYHS